MTPSGTMSHMELAQNTRTLKMLTKQQGQLDKAQEHLCNLELLHDTFYRPSTSTHKVKPKAT